MKVSYRSGRAEDCPVLAKLVNIASEGVIEFLFHGLVPEMTPEQMVAHNLGSDNSHYSYKNTIVAEYNSDPIGVSLSYPAHFHQITEEMKQFLPKDRLDHFKTFYSSRVEDSLFLNALCVDDRFRRKGIGAELISLTKKNAQKSGFTSLSLMVLADNKDAQCLYRKCGFEVKETIDLKRHELIPHDGGCLLMKSTIEP